MSEREVRDILSDRINDNAGDLSRLDDDDYDDVTDIDWDYSEYTDISIEEQ
jgi:hypothetical protein